MIFNSLAFLCFFAVVLAVHYSPAPMSIRRGSLLIANVLFFASYHPPYVLLLTASTVIDWLLANQIDRSEGGSRRRWLSCSIVLNMGVLCFFKYADFALLNFQHLLQTFGVVYQPAQFRLILPVGLSFYTFQALSYTIDVYYRRIRPEPSLLNFAMFVSFFPHLVAGPILRARDILPQCREFHRATAAELGWGLNLLVWGLFQKVILADHIFAPVADKVYAEGMVVSTLEAWSGALAFTGQIFFDFAGYSTCAIGAALCLGFRIPDNFRFPYGSLGFSDFWQRWHISLSSWLRDYLYIPLGGNRKGAIRTRINLVVTMLLGGLWHGAAWHYVAWGAYHGLLLIGERQAAPAIAAMGRRISGAKVVGWLATLYFVVLGWVIFRATTLDQARRMLSWMHHAPQHADIMPISQAMTPIVATAIVAALHYLLRRTTIESIYGRAPMWLRGAWLGLITAVTVLFAGKATGFIYFQF